MQTLKFMLTFCISSLLVLVTQVNACSGGDGGSDGGNQASTSIIDDIYIGNMDFESVDATGVAGDTLEIPTEPMTEEEMEQMIRDEKKNEIFWSGLESNFWSSVSGLMSVGEFGSKVVVFGSGVAIATLAAPGTVVITAGGTVVGTISAGTSLAIGTTYSVVTTVASGGGGGDATKAGTRTLAISVLLPNAAPIVQGAIDTGLAEFGPSLPDVSPNTSENKTPTYPSHSPNYAGTTTTNTGQVYYH